MSATLNPKPVAHNVPKVDPFLTEFATIKGEIIRLPTQAQAEAKAKKLLEKFKPEEWWAQKVSRFRQGRDEYFVGYIVKDYSKDHDRSDLAKTSEDQMWFGRIEIGIPAMETDEDSHSDTHQQRVPKTLALYGNDGNPHYYPVLDRKGFHNFTKVTKENIALYKKMVGMTMDDIETQYIYVIAKGGRTISADDPDDFWTVSCEEVKLDDRLLAKARRDKEKAEIRDKNATEKLK